jgi:hypothetical protein
MRESLESIGKVYQELNPELVIILYMPLPISIRSTKFIFYEGDDLGNLILKDKPIRVYFYDNDKMVRVKRVGLEGCKDYYFFNGEIYKKFKKDALGEGKGCSL